MKHTTKATLGIGVLGAIVTGLAVIAGKLAGDCDRMDKEVDEEFDSLGTTEPEDDIEGDIIEPEEEAETEPEEV